MKKMLLILLIVVGFGFAANAQVCKNTGNVEWNIYKDGSRAQAEFTNFNDYQVTVEATINVVDKSGKTKQYRRTYVIAAKKNKSGWFEGYTEVSYESCRESWVDMTVSRCD